MSDHDGITSAVLLQHMQAMEGRLTNKIDTLEFNFDKRFNRLERKTDLILLQMNNIDERVDDIEVVQLPAI